MPESIEPGAASHEREPGDDDLVVRARNDRAAFAALYRRYVTAIHRYCYRRLGNREAAEDATSQTFARALASLPNYRQRDNGSFRGWLFTIAHHVATDMLRADRPQAALDEAWWIADESPSPEQAALDGEDRRLVQALLITLPPAERRVVELRLAGLTSAEMAAVLGKTRNAVDVAQLRAVRRLQALLPAPGSEEVIRGRR